MLSIFSKKWNSFNSVTTKNFMEDGSDIRWEDTQEFTFPIKGGRVIKVYDGDTITIATKLPWESSPLYRVSVRLRGIDTPEMKGRDISFEEKEAAKEAREFVYKLVFNKFVRLENIQNEKYGRILADVYIGEIHLNELLLKEGYAVKYDGGTKIKPINIQHHCEFFRYILENKPETISDADKVIIRGYLRSVDENHPISTGSQSLINSFMFGRMHEFEPWIKTKYHKQL